MSNQAPNTGDFGHNESESVGKRPDLQNPAPKLNRGAAIDLTSKTLPKDGIVEIGTDDDILADEQQRAPQK